MSEPTQRISAAEREASARIPAAGEMDRTLCFSDELGGDSFRQATLVLRPGEDPDDAAVRARKVSPVTTIGPEHDDDEREPGELEHRSFGRYRLVHELGRGGMGVVYLAFDIELGREVAIKVLRLPDSGRDADKRRFGNEARITSQLEHPGIVPVHDAGITPDGDLYYTMKRVRGRGLAEVARCEVLSLVKKVEILIAVCNAMEYAHAHGVVHRDLKPDNVLIGDYGEVMIVDWGLARLYERELEARTDTAPPAGGVLASAGVGEQASTASIDANLTQAGEVIGTIAYMSPEQARGEQDRVGPASDIYAVGAILFELLTGTPPFVFGGGVTVRGMLLEVSEGARPDAHVVDASVPADLAAIARKAMAVRIADRYDGVTAMREDLEAFLEKRPVSAHDATAMFRLGKFLDRHRGIVRAVVGGALALVVALAGFALQLYGEKERVAQEKERVVQAKAKLKVAKERAEQALVKFKEADAARAKERAARERLMQAEELLTSASMLLKTDASSAEGLRRLDQAIEAAPGYYRSYYAKARALGAIDRLDEALAAVDLALARRDYLPAQWLRADLLRRAAASGKPADRKRRLAEARAQYEGIAKRVGDEQAQALTAKGYLSLIDGKNAEALRQFEQALALEPGLLQAMSGRADALGFGSMQLVLDQLQALGKRARGDQYIANMIRQRIKELDAQVVVTSQRSPFIDFSAAMGLHRARQYAKAIEHYDRAIRGFRASDNMRGQLAVALSNKSRCLRGLRKPEEAVEPLQEACKLLDEIGDAQAPLVHRDLGDLYNRLGRWKESHAELEHALKVLLEKRQYATAVSVGSQLADSLMRLGDLERAGHWLHVASKASRRARGSSVALYEARLLRLEGEAEEGLEVLREAMENVRPSTWAARLRLEVARCLMALERPQEALDELLQLSRLLKRYVRDRSSRTQLELFVVGLTMKAQTAKGEPKTAIATGEQTLRAMTKRRVGGVLLYQLRFDLGVLYGLTGNTEQANQHLRAAEKLAYTPGDAHYPRLYRAVFTLGGKDDGESARRKQLADEMRPAIESTPRWPAPLLAELVGLADSSKGLAEKAARAYPAFRLELVYITGERELARGNQFEATNHFKVCAGSAALQDRMCHGLARARLRQLSKGD